MVNANLAGHKRRLFWAYTSYCEGKSNLVSEEVIAQISLDSIIPLFRW